jgi:regulator of sirC expression with transglutaminase-like and TPR domain
MVKVYMGATSLSRTVCFRWAAVAVFSFAFLGAVARADQGERTWTFELTTPGSYKVQVAHETTAPVPAPALVTYTVTIGQQTQSRQLDLVTNRPFIPLIADVPTPQQMRVAISGLPEEALRHTRAQVFDAALLEPEQDMGLDKRANAAAVHQIRAILQQPAEDIDLARTELTIDKLIDPTVDVDANLHIIDSMVAAVRVMPDFGVDSGAKLLALKKYVYEPGPWNNGQAFQYDLEDPLGTIISNKLLSHYIAIKKGNCVTMPFLFIVLGQRLGLDVTASTAPKHFLVKFNVGQAGAWINLEATSGANPARDVWIRQQIPMTDEALANGVYLQPLTKKETVAAMTSVLAEYYFTRRDYETAIAISELALRYYPKDVAAMTMKGASYFRLLRRDFLEKYKSPSDIPAAQQVLAEELSRGNHLWFAKAEALGWREETKEQDDQYLQRIDRARERSSPNN